MNKEPSQGLHQGHHGDKCVLYLENDGGAGFLLQDSGGAERLEVRVGVVEQVGVVVHQQRLDVVEDEAELVGVLHRLQTLEGLCRQGWSQAAHARGVQHLTHLEENEQKTTCEENLLFETLMHAASTRDPETCGSVGSGSMTTPSFQLIHCKALCLSGISTETQWEPHEPCRELTRPNNWN